MPSFSNTVKQELLSWKIFISIIIIAFLYISLSILLLNNRLFFSLIQDHLISFSTLLLFFSLFVGLWTSLSASDFFITILTALLVGINISLLLRTIALLGNKEKLHISIGGATIIGFVTTGCASCGLSILSLLGLSTTVSILPFHGLELHIGAVILLFFSCWYMLRQIHNGIYCKIKKRHK